MQVSVERLRVGLLVGAGLLVLATVVFLGYAKYRAKAYLTELPKKLGVDVRQEANGYTYSQTVKGRTVFTVHAAKEIQHQDNTYTLHDVGIVLYGQGQSNRTDRIYGKEFTYDPNTGVMKAQGEVHLDLQAPAPANAEKMDYAAGKDLKDEKKDEAPGDERLIHVKTSGLVFMRQLGVAATDEEIEFVYNGLTGHAKGADYNSDNGVLVLHSAVKVNGLAHEQPILLTASHADLDRLNHKVVLEQTKYGSVGGDGNQTAEARHAVVYLRQDGSAERLEAEGAVTLTRADGSKVVSERAEGRMNAQSQPEWGRMFGGVHYVADTPERQANGNAQEAVASFDGKGHLKQLVMVGDVSSHERVRTDVASGKTAGVGQWSERELNAGRVELAFATGESGNAQLRDAKASENASLKVTNPGKDGKGVVKNAMSGDLLTAHMVMRKGVVVLDSADGSGHTSLREVSETGQEQTSSGDSLHVQFRSAERRAGQGTKPPSSGEASGNVEIASAVQQGNVVLTRKPVPVAGQAAEMQRATAAKAVYDGGVRTVTLEGGVQMSENDGVLWADRATMAQDSGDAQAEGNVRASYKQAGQADEVHVLASRAELKKAENKALFYGAAKPARLWQGGSQVEAPVLEFTQNSQPGGKGNAVRRLVARDNAKGTSMAVHTVLVSAKPVDAPAKGATKGPGVVRVRSGQLLYTDETRTAVFTNGVVIESTDGTMHGQQATAYMQQPQTKSAVTSAADGLLGGSVDRVVIAGQITMEQTGRSATGEQLVYTASDGMFVLTGRPGEPPKVIDQTRGIVTGEVLRFRNGDESVVVSKGEQNGGEQRVHTETRVKKER